MPTHLHGEATSQQRSPRELRTFKDTGHARCRTQCLASRRYLPRRRRLHDSLTPALGGKPSLSCYHRAPPTASPQVRTPLYLLRKRMEKNKAGERRRQEENVGAQVRDDGSEGDTGKGSISLMRLYTIKLNSCSQGFHTFLKPTEIPHELGGRLCPRGQVTGCQ